MVIKKRAKNKLKKRSTVELSFKEPRVPTQKELIEHYFKFLKKKLREFRSKKKNIGKPFTGSREILIKAGIPGKVAEELARKFEDKYFSEAVCAQDSVCFTKVRDQALQKIRPPRTEQEKLQGDLNTARGKLNKYVRMGTSLKRALKTSEGKRVNWPDVKNFELIIQGELGEVASKNFDVSYADWFLRRVSDKQKYLKRQIVELKNSLSKHQKKEKIKK